MGCACAQNWQSLALMYKIIVGDYQFAPTRLGKKVQVDSESQFNLFSSSLSDHDSITLLQRDIEVTSLRISEKQITGAQRLKQEVMEFINATTTSQQDLVQEKVPINSWEDVVRRYPKLADSSRHAEWLPFTVQRTAKQGWSLKGQAMARLNADKPSAALLVVCRIGTQQICCGLEAALILLRLCVLHYAFSAGD